MHEQACSQNQGELLISEPQTFLTARFAHRIITKIAIRAPGKVYGYP